MRITQRSPTAEQPEAPPVAPGLPPLYHPIPLAAASARGGINLASIVLLAILGLVVTIGALFLMLVASSVGVGGRTLGEVGQRASDATRAAGEAAGRAGQDVRDQLDPSHPPRGLLVYDAEIDEFIKLGVGQALPAGRSRTFTVAAIRSRQDGERPETSRYAVIHSELRQPNETKILGVTVRRDSDPQDYAVYQGEGFRIGGQVYKVNWISPEREQIALVALRDPDRAALPPKFSLEP